MSLPADRAARLRSFIGEEADVGPGTFVSERVRLKARIATGGMGTVWRAEHTTLGVDVAVKLLTDEVRDDPDAITRFQNEASTASRLASAHVVKVLDFGLFAGDTPYLVMELLEGEDLAALLAREGPRSPAEVGDIVEQAARGLTAAHDVGFIHRDVKPQNLFIAKIDEKPIVKLLDFGVARRPVASETTTTKSGQLLGTPLYMGPEQLTRPSDIDRRADLWSLAVVAYEALTGRLPFDGETVGALAIAVDRGQFTPPSQLSGSVPRSLDAWFQRAFANDPADRFQSAGELATTFRTAAKQSAPRRSWPLLAALVAAVSIAVVALASSGPTPAANLRDPPSSQREAPVEPSTEQRADVPPAASATPSGSDQGPAPTATENHKTATKSAARSNGSPPPAKSLEHATPTATGMTSDKPKKDRGF